MPVYGGEAVIVGTEALVVTLGPDIVREEGRRVGGRSHMWGWV